MQSPRCFQHPCSITRYLPNWATNLYSDETPRFASEYYTTLRQCLLQDVKWGVDMESRLWIALVVCSCSGVISMLWSILVCRTGAGREWGIRYISHKSEICQSGVITHDYLADICVPWAIACDASKVSCASTVCGMWAKDGALGDEQYIADQSMGKSRKVVGILGAVLR